MVESNKPSQEIEEAAIDLAPRVTAALAKVRRLVEAERRKVEVTKRLIELRELLQRNADKSQALLQNIENNAPIKAAINQFIYESRTGYQQALQVAGATQEALSNVDAALQPQSRGENQAEAGDGQSLQATVRAQVERGASYRLS